MKMEAEAGAVRPPAKEPVTGQILPQPQHQACGHLDLKLCLPGLRINSVALSHSWEFVMAARSN